MQAVLTLAQAETDMKLSPRPKTQLEAALVKLCMPKMSPGETQLLQRIEQLEQQIKDLQRSSVRKTAAEETHIQPAEPGMPEEAPPWESSPPWEEAPPMQEEDMCPPWETAEKPLEKPKRNIQKKQPQQKPRPVQTENPVRENSVLDQIFAVFSKKQPGAAYFLKRAESARQDGETLWLEFAPVNENLVQALRQFQQDLEQAAEQALGSKVEIQFKIQKPEEKEKTDVQDVLKKAQQAFGLDIEMEE